MSQTLSAPPVQRGNLASVKSLQDAFDHPQFIARLKQATPKHLSPDRMLAVFIQSVQKTPTLKDAGVLSLLGAFISLATVGLEPNTPLGHAYLIPFKKNKYDRATKQWVYDRTDIQVIFGYQGLLDLTFRSKMTRSIHADVVWTGDDFDFWYGSGGQLKHKPRSMIDPNGQLLSRDQGQLPEYAYMHANLAEGGESYEVMPMADVLSLRNSTQAYQSAVRALDEAKEKNWKIPATYTEAPWVKHLVPMTRKTVLRAGIKWLPKSIEMAAASQLDEQQDRQMVDFGAVIEGKADIFSGLPEAEGSDNDETDPAENSGHTGFSRQENRPSQQQQQKTSTTKNPVNGQSKASEKPIFTGVYIISAEGEVDSDMIEDPDIYVDKMSEYLDKASPADRQAITENNADALATCEKAGFKLALPKEGGTASSSEAPAVSVLPIPKGGPAAWLKDARPIVAKLTAEQMPEWISLNSEVWLTFATRTREEVEKLVAARCAALNLPWAPPRPIWHPEQFAEQVDAATSTAELNKLTSHASTDLNMLRRDDLVAFNVIEARIITRREELKKEEGQANGR